MPDLPKTLIVLATYNEIENLPRLVDEVFGVAPQVDILVVDDNSPDGTGRWCDERAASETRLSCLHRPGKLGLGTATLDGMRHALADGYDLVVTMDADFSHPPRYIPQLIEKAKDADVVIGSRYCRGGGIEGWPLRRRISSHLVNSASRFMLRLPVRDASGAFRCYRTDMLERLDFSSIQSTGYAYLEEILWRLKQLGARFAEVPIAGRMLLSLAMQSWTKGAASRGSAVREE